MIKPLFFRLLPAAIRWRCLAPDPGPPHTPSGPIFPRRAHRRHWGLDHPVRVMGADEGALASFRRVRDEIRRVFEAYAAGWRDARPT